MCTAGGVGAGLTLVVNRLGANGSGEKAQGCFFAEVGGLWGGMGNNRFGTALQRAYSISAEGEWLEKQDLELNSSVILGFLGIGVRNWL